MRRTYNDKVLNYIYNGLINTSFDHVACSNYIVDYNIGDRAKALSLSHLETFTTKEFEDLHYNESDGRVWTPFLALKSDFRSYSKFKDLSRLYTLDIRAAHPTFFSSYVMALVEASNQPLNSTKPLINKLSKQGNLRESTYSATERIIIKEEHDRWVRMFTGEEDARIIISKQCNYKTIEQCKQYLNKTINGNLTHKPLIKWKESNFPTLCEVWNQTDKALTGPAISRMFETNLTLNPILYDMFTELKNVYLHYEYDGFSIYGNTNDQHLIHKANCVSTKIKELCEEQFGFKCVLKLESLFQTNNLTESVTT